MEAYINGSPRQLPQLLEKILPKGRIDSLTQSETEAILTYGLVQLDRNTLTDLPERLGEVAENLKVNVFFDRAGEV